MTETRSLSHPVQKPSQNESETLMQHLKLLQHIREILQDIGTGNTFLSSGNKNKNWQIELYQIKKLLHNKRNDGQSEETAYRVGEKSLADNKRLLSRIHLYSLKNNKKSKLSSQ
jgi:DNA repair ATPase RecN